MQMKSWIGFRAMDMYGNWSQVKWIYVNDPGWLYDTKNVGIIYFAF